MRIPTIEAEDYPPARRVVFEFSVPGDDWEDPPPGVTEFCRDGVCLDIKTTRPYLTAMKVCDNAFAAQLMQDEALQHTYTSMRKFGLSEKLIAKNSWLKSQILTIERALLNRMDFAMQQKIHVSEQAPFLSSKTEKERIQQEADSEMLTVISIVKDWKSDSLKDTIQEFVETVENLMH